MPVENLIPLLYSSTPNTKPLVSTRLTGELWTNFADNQLGLIDAGQAAQPLLAVRFFSTLTAYSSGDCVVQGGKLYVAKAAVPAGPFVPAQWAAYQTAVDNAALYLALTGGTLTGPLLLAADPSAALGAATKQYADRMLPLAGGTLTGSLILKADPGALLEAATKQYVDGKVTAAPFLPLAGGTLTGALTLVGAPNYATLQLAKSASGNANQVIGYTGGLGSTQARWNMQIGDTAAESGSNAGSNFGISRYSDAGAFIDTPFSINRATGGVTFGGNIAVTGGITAGGINVLGNLSISAPGTLVQTAFIRMGTNNYNFNVSGPALQIGVNGATFGTLPKSLVVGSFTSILDTTALNAAGAQMAAWSGGTGATWSVAISSDRRLKSGLALSSKDALEAIAAMPVYECDMTQPLEGAQQQHWDWALIADEVKPVVPLAVMDADPEAGIEYAVMRDYPLIPLLIRAVQQLTARVAELEGAAAK